MVNVITGFGDPCGRALTTHNLVEKIENNKTSNQSEEEYIEIFKLNRLIEKKFQNTSKEISEKNRLKIKQILKKNGKKAK